MHQMHRITCEVLLAYGFPGVLAWLPGSQGKPDQGTLVLPLLVVLVMVVVVVAGVQRQGL